MYRKLLLIFSVSLASVGLLQIVSYSTVLAQQSSSSSSSSASQSCHLRELDLCAATLLVFTQSPSGLAVNDNDLNKQCVHLREADNCLKSFTKRCMTPVQRELISMAANGSLKLLDEYCTKGSPLRQSYLKHSTCLNQAQKTHQKFCIKELQASLEALTGHGDVSNKRLQIGCCTYKRFEACIGGHVERKCGKDALNFINLVVRRATSRMPELVCKSYKPDTPECKALLPKPGSAPKGAKSNSVISRLFSAYTGL